MSENKKYKILNKEEKSNVTSLEIEIPFEEVSKHREGAIKSLGANVEIKGFRKGAAPEKMVEEKIGAMKILEEMAYQTVVEILPVVAIEEKIDALTQPKISITKIAEGNPMVFKAEFILMPEIKLADYKKIAAEIPAVGKVKVEDKEIEDYIAYLLKSKGDAEQMRKKTSDDPKEREEAEKNGDTLPELDDAFVKTLGNFKDVADFKKQLTENMQKEKETSAKQKRRIEIVEKIISESDISLPDIMIEEELHQMMHEFENNLQNAKMNLDDYLKEIKKTKEDLFKDWRLDAIKRSKMNLVLPKIAMEEKIEADPEKVAHEVKHLKEHNENIKDEQATSYVSHILRNDEVCKFLEEIK